MNRRKDFPLEVAWACSGCGSIRYKISISCEEELESYNNMNGPVCNCGSESYLVIRKESL